MAKPRLLLADDHELLVDGLRKLLSAEFDLVGAVADGRAVVQAYKDSNPDLLLLDIVLPLLNGIEAARQVRRAASGARILFVTMHTDRVYVQEAFRAGASGYVLKQAAASDLIAGIRAVLLGRTYVSPKIAEMLGAAGTPIPVNGTKLFGTNLTPRQREVLQLIAEGKALKEIAHILKVSVRTVEFHKSGLMDTLGLRTTAELARYAADQGIVLSLSS